MEPKVIRTLICSGCFDIKPVHCFRMLPNVVCHSCHIVKNIHLLRTYKVKIVERKGRHKIFREDLKGYKID